MKRRSILALTSGTLAAPALLSARAQEVWPSRPIRIVVPFPPGSASDTLARGLAARMSEALGQTTVVENRPGAGGTIGTDVVAKAAPDGHTFLMATAAHTITAATYAKLPFDAKGDFVPVTRLIATPLVLVVHPSVEARTVAELVALARRSPGAISFASSGNGTSHQMASELLKSLAKIDIVHVPYRGSAPAQTDLVAGRCQMMFDNIVAVIGQVRDGRLRAVAVSTPERSAILPDVPTVAESGYPGFEVSAWFGLMAPKGTPAAIIEKGAQVAGAAVQHPSLAERLVAEGAIVNPDGPAAFARFLDSDFSKWEVVAREGQIRLSD
ncbi:Bug family tripartite tricarboxylate transporter substrate binding protein [Muricoccus aerilatus]|uniref:Bug family tripartite tricarboxylate transporter substrate binding protein n=1 Tax=Muricoccus aerilatus TaxID=452982 RepID=UPI0005C1BA51|nr:tripartite tricarboxylate transporter substrate binding protein [Roseomonas aerilata]